MDRLLVTLVFFVLLSSCKDDSVSIDDENQTTTSNSISTPAIITGKVLGSSAPTIETVSIYAYDYLTADFEEFNSPVNGNGEFFIKVPLDRGLELTGTAGKNFSLIAAPGDSIYIEVRPEIIDSANVDVKLQFTGDRSLTNTALQDYNKNFPIDVQTYYDSKELDAIGDFTAFAKANKTTISNYNKAFLKDTTDDLLIDYLNAQERFYFPTAKADFVNYRSYYGLSIPDPDSKYFRFIDSIPELRERDLVNVGVSQRLIYNLVYFYDSKVRYSNPDYDEDTVTVQSLKLASNIDHNPTLRDYLLHSIYYRSLKDHNLNIYQDTQEIIERSIRNSAIKSSIATKYKEEKKLLTDQQLPPGAQLMTFNTQDPEKYLDEIIANASGKVVYIDNWATWCAPCKEEFKNASPALHEKYENRVEFVYLCHNSPERSYLPTIQQFKIKGKHYYLNDRESQIISRMINLEGFPTYTIIDKSGTIVLSDYIHRPSFPATSDLLKKLIDE